MESNDHIATYDPQAPWPCMRGNTRSTGVSPVVELGAYRRSQGSESIGSIRHFRTGNSVFSTPIIGPDETIYVGSADGNFYAFDPMSGRQRWRFETREVIDCAGSIAADGTIYFASCDACLYALDATNGKERWRIDMLKDRQYFSPTTIYWWEANVVLGPTGLIYAPSDDFYLYAIDPRGEIRWAGLTGLLIWTAPAFGPDGSVYVVSFDTHAYAFDARTGDLRWRSPTGNFVASSPAVGADGTIFFGSFDGQVYALDGESGGIRWHVGTGGPIYASPAIAPDGTLYIGSSDGQFYAISTDRQDIKWTFYTGDAIRSSASVGPDPEGSCDHLVYLGGGDGRIYALDPMGHRRWSYDTLTRARSTDYPNINASIAIGRHGLATASANGDVIWVPYDAYLQKPAYEGFSREATDGYPGSGSFWYYVSPGGAVAQDAEAAIQIHPTENISLRLVARETGRTLPAKIVPETVELEVDPPFEHRLTVQPDRSQINLIPVDIPEADRTYRISARAAATAPSGQVVRVQGTKLFQTRPPITKPSAAELTQTPFSICQMAVYAPPIVPSFDQIGIASLTIDVRVIEVEPSSGAVIAWGIQKFGTTESGETVGTPIPRHLYYPFSGIYRDGHLILESESCNFELTGFPVPLDRLRFSGSCDDRGLPGIGTSMAAAYRLPRARDLLARKGPAEMPSAGELLSAGGRSLRAAGRGLARIASFVSSWFPDGQPLWRTAPQVAEAARLTLPLARDLLRGMHAPWGLFDEEGQFHGVGTFRVAPLANAATPRVKRFEFDHHRRRLSAELEGAPASSIPAIMVVDEDEGRPLFLDYNRLTQVTRKETLSVQLELPLSAPIKGRRHKAILLSDTSPAGEVALR